MEERVNVGPILTRYAGTNTGGRAAATGKRGDPTLLHPALYTEAGYHPRPEQEPLMPLPDPPKRYESNPGFHLLIGLILVGVLVAWFAL